MIVTLNDVLNDYDVRYGETIRTNCPYCKGYNTFSVTNMGGSIVWNCYKASCKASGAKGVMWSIDDIELCAKRRKRILCYQNTSSLQSTCGRLGRQL